MDIFAEWTVQLHMSVIDLQIAIIWLQLLASKLTKRKLLYSCPQFSKMYHHSTWFNTKFLAWKLGKIVPQSAACMCT